MQPVYLQMTLSLQLGMSESITLWHFKHSLLILTFTRAVSSPRLLEIGIHLQILSFLLLKVQKTMGAGIAQSLDALYFTTELRTSSARVRVKPGTKYVYRKYRSECRV